MFICLSVVGADFAGGGEDGGKNQARGRRSSAWWTPARHKHHQRQTQQSQRTPTLCEKCTFECRCSHESGGCWRFFFMWQLLPFVWQWRQRALGDPSVPDRTEAPLKGKTFLDKGCARSSRSTWSLSETLIRLHRIRLHGFTINTSGDMCSAGCVLAWTLFSPPPNGTEPHQSVCGLLT